MQKNKETEIQLGFRRTDQLWAFRHFFLFTLFLKKIFVKKRSGSTLNGATKCTLHSAGCCSSRCDPGGSRICTVTTCAFCEMIRHGFKTGTYFERRNWVRLLPLHNLHTKTESAHFIKRSMDDGVTRTLGPAAQSVLWHLLSLYSKHNIKEFTVSSFSRLSLELGRRSPITSQQYYIFNYPS